MVKEQKQKNDFNVLLFSLLFVLFYAPLLDAKPLIKSISYRILPAPDPYENCLIVEGDFKESNSNEIFVIIPSVVKKLDLFIQKKKINFEKTNDPQLFKIPNPGKKDIQFRYAYCVQNPTRNIYFPIIEKDFIHVLVSSFLITPEVRFEKATININFTGFSHDYQMATSFNVGQKQYQIQTQMEDFRNSILCLGKISIDKFKVNTSEVNVVSNGKWSYFEKSPHQFIKEIFKVQREFWQDHQFPHYVIFLIKQNPPFISRIFLGRHWHNAFSSVLPEDPDAREKVLYGLSHEAFHAWLGGKMKIPQPQGNLQWFFEGFTDFYGLLLSYESGSITLKDYLEIYNNIIKEYLLSPLIEVTNEEINQHFTLDNHFNQIAQVRSHIVAKQLRDKFKHLSHNNFDLTMKSLFYDYQQKNGKDISFEIIDKTFNENIGHHLWQESKNVLIDGSLIKLSPKAFDPFATLKVLEIDVPDFGFNTKQMLLNSKITEINENSAAFKAGLREGQIVEAYNIDFKSLEKVFLQVNDQGIKKTVIFIPERQCKKIPQYVLRKKRIFGK